MTRDVGPAVRYVSLPRHGGRDTETSRDAPRIACRRGPEVAARGDNRGAITGFGCVHRCDGSRIA
ncbi:hypothetical protein Syun_006463 [Stephania yunnanensis]|uniref:Uncharacterized protein n=1 Tax=Stephania yunnanensis TaxID=152371 RepID=A0AAP0KWK9_9MAGN